MKRKDLERLIRRRAARRHLAVTVVEGGSHTKVRVGERQTTVPRHTEIGDLLARRILRQLGLEED